MIPHAWWIRATYVTTGRPWVTTDELERSQRSKLAAIWAQGLEPGWAGRAREFMHTSKKADDWPSSHRFVHNVLAHPLLVLCPPLGQRLHDQTAPPDDGTQPNPWRGLSIDTIEIIATTYHGTGLGDAARAEADRRLGR